MLHVGILPHHAAWGDLFANLAFVVVDEAHVYRGVFGSHVGNVLRRLRRAAAIYGTEPRFLLASATIANPVELAERLTGLTRLQPRRSRHRAPSRRAGSPCGTRRCSTSSSASAPRRSTRRPRCSPSWSASGARTICFMKSRKGVELILRHAADRLEPELAERIAPYRARLHAGPAPRDRAPADRRRAARRGGHRRARARHRHRRARRRRSASPSPAPWPACARCGAAPAAAAAAWPSTSPARTRSTSSSAATPTSSSSRPVEAAILDPDSPRDLRRASALRRPRGAAERRRRADSSAPSGATTPEALAEAGLLRERATGFVPERADDYPAARVALRSASADSFVADRRRLGRGARARSRPAAPTRPCTRAPSTCTSAAPTACSSSTSRRAARCSSPSTATTSPRPSARA